MSLYNTRPQPPPQVSYQSPQMSYQPPPGPPPRRHHTAQNGPPPPLFIQQNHQSFSPAPPPYSMPPPPQHSPLPPQPTASHPRQTYYPFVEISQKRSYGLLAPNAPNHAPPLLVVEYPSSLDMEPKIKVIRCSDNAHLATITAHSFTTSKVDVAMHNGGGEYHFKKKFASQTGLARRGGKLIWDTPGGGGLSGILGGDKSELLLSEEGGGVVARFQPAGGKLGKHERVGGAFEMGSLGERQFEEVFVTGVAELERRRRDAEDQKVAKAVIGQL